MDKQYLKIMAQEKATYLIEVNLLDEQGAAVTPLSATWSLTDYAGTVINSRSQIPFGVLGSDMEAVLTGDDLALLATDDDDRVPRCFTIEATYNSAAGSNLPLKQEAWFYLNRLVAI